MNAFDKARKDPRVTPLLTEVENSVRLEFVAAKHDGWGSNMEDGRATIWWSSCRHPSASLTHELLHLRLQTQGYRRIRISISNIADPQTSKILMDAIDNEIQHHKFYKEFLNAGFHPHQFYADSDADIERFLDGEIDSGPHVAASVATIFLSLIAPGGNLMDSAKSRIRAKLVALESGVHTAMLENIERLLRDWTASVETDATAYIKNILLAVRPTNNLTWYGFRATDRPPDVGVFVDQEFGVQEA